jgi:hypothetical protein
MSENERSFLRHYVCTAIAGGNMTTRLLAAITLAITLGFNASPLMADHDKGDKHEHGNKHSDHEGGWEQRGGYEYHAYQGGNVPPGWSHGKKTGWGDCGMPPGQAKKYGCRTYTYQGRPYYYFQNESGQILVRRPAIEVHGGVEIVP